MGQTLLIAELDAAKVEDAVLHGAFDSLPAACFFALEQRRDDAQRDVESGAGITDLGGGHHRGPVMEAGGGRRAARALGDVLIDLAVLVRPGAETLDRGADQPRVDLVNPFMREAHAVQRAWRKVFDHDVADLDELGEDRLALFGLGIEGEGALVAVEHGEIEAVHALDVAQLMAGDVAGARAFDLDDVGPEPRQQLRACGTRLDMGHVQDADAFQSFHCTLLLVRVDLSGFIISWRRRFAG